jgi:hypothetical protein
MLNEQDIENATRIGNKLNQPTHQVLNNFELFIKQFQNEEEEEEE